MPSTKSAQKIGRFEVIRRIGAGGQGTVFQARDPQLERAVAIKLIHDDRLMADRPPPEGQLLARLRHPNIVSVFETGVLGTLPYLVFEYIEGVTLKTFIDRQRLTREEVCDLMMQILAGAAHAHERGIVHLDLTPGNILIDRDRVPRIMDFGLARAMGRTQPAAEHTIGSLRYMSPEHFDGGDLGAHTDVFALSLVFFEMLTGQPMLEGNSRTAIVHQLLGDTLDLGALASDSAMQPVCRVIRGGLERHPGARYPNAAALRAALGAAMKSADLGTNGATSHATVEFFLRRMQRKQDFPGLSRSLADINSLTSADSNASIEQLSNVILRDYALTKKLLQLANSAFYGGGVKREVANVTQAIRLLGFEQIRMTANSLCYAKHLQSQADNAKLKEAVTRSFVSGLITRHLARQSKLPGAEEAFIAGMFRNIGEHLTIYYFPEEHADIEAYMSEHQTTMTGAVRRVLGVTFSELGASVARAWKLPVPIIEVIEASPDGRPLPNAAPEDELRNLAVFANALCAIPGTDDMAPQDEALHALCARFEGSGGIDVASAYRLLEGALEKFRQFAPILGVHPGRSGFCRDLEQWLSWWHRDAPVGLSGA